MKTTQTFAVAFLSFVAPTLALAMGEHPAQIWKEELPALKTNSLVLQLPEFATSRPEQLPARIDFNDFTSSTDVRVQSGALNKILKSAELSSERSTRSQDAVFELRKPQCDKTTYSKSATFEMHITLEDWLQAQSLWCKMGNWLFGTCHPESTQELLTAAQATLKIQNETSTDPSTHRVEENCLDGVTPTPGTTPLDYLSGIAKTGTAAPIASRTSFHFKDSPLNQDPNGTYILTTTQTDSIIISAKRPDLVTQQRETLTTTTDLVEVEALRFHAKRERNEWRGKITPAQQLGVRQKTPLHSTLTAIYQETTSSSIRGIISTQTRAVAKAVTLGLLQVSIDPTVWSTLRSKHPEQMGPYLLRAASNDSQTLVRCDANPSALSDCHRVVFLKLTPGGEAEVIDVSTNARLVRSNGVTSIQGDDLRAVEGEQIDVYEARLIKSGVTNRFPKDQFNYYIDGQSALATLGNVIGGLFLGLTIGHFERVITPKTDLPQRFFFETESIRSILWIPSGNLTTLDFELIQ